MRCIAKEIVMTKDELMQMARDSAAIHLEYSKFAGEAIAEINTCQLEAFTNAILERAASIAEKNGHYWCGSPAQAMFDIAESIRALKINTGN